MKKVDFHSHPLCHEYYYDNLAPKQLTDFDKEAVKSMINEGIRRGLDGIALTDHNMVAGSFYGKRYAKMHQLPIKIIAGAECSLVYNNAEIHVLALGVDDYLEIDSHMKPYELIDQIHDHGGIAVLAHPHYYNISVYEDLAHLVDGVEYYNGVNASMHPHSKFFERLKQENYSGLWTYGSDYHLSRRGMTPEQEMASFEIRDALFARLTR